MITHWSKSFKNKFYLVHWLLSKAKKLQIGLFLESSFSQSNTFKDGQTCQRKTICTQHQHTDITSKIFKRYTWVTSMSTSTMLQDVQMLLRAERLCSTSKVLSYLHVSLLTMLVILTNCLTNSLVHRQPPPQSFSIQCDKWIPEVKLTQKIWLNICPLSHTPDCIFTK